MLTTEIQQALASDHGKIALWLQRVVLDDILCKACIVVMCITGISGHSTELKYRRPDRVEVRETEVKRDEDELDDVESAQRQVAVDAFQNSYTPKQYYETVYQIAY